MKWLVGVDEVGRGPLAGPISVGVVVALERHYPKVCRALRTLGSGDSKTLSAARRERGARGPRGMAARGAGLGGRRSGGWCQFSAGRRLARRRPHGAEVFYPALNCAWRGGPPAHRRGLVPRQGQPRRADG